MTEPVEPRDDWGILLPCTTETFTDFISSLLGKPQSIERVFSGNFEISRHDLENTFHLITQRVQQQNEASLVQFVATISYDDDSSVRLNSYEDFERYVEVRPLVSVGVTFSWTYLVRFPDRNVPEKQIVEFWVNASHIFTRHVPVVLVGPFMNHGQIGFRIDHTARTWGADLESLLTGHAQTLLKEETGLRRFVSNHSGKVGAIVGGSLGLAILAGTFVLSHRFASYQLAQARTALQTGNAASKINFLIENAARGEWIQFGNVLVFIIIGGCLAALGLAAWASSAAELPPLAFVLLTKRAEERRILRLASRRRRWASFVLSIILSIIASVLANILFAWAF